MEYENRKLLKEILIGLLVLVIAAGIVGGIIIGSYRVVKNAERKIEESKYQLQVQVLEKKEETKTNGFLFIVFTSVSYKIIVSDKDGERHTFEVSESDYVKFDVDGFYNIEVVLEKAKYIEKLEIEKPEEEIK